MSAVDIRGHFPILARQIGKQSLVYLDNAATTQKPRVVIDAISHYYSHYNANVHRAAHLLADEATQAMEQSRTDVQSFIGAADSAEIVFTRGTTESINLIASVLTARIDTGDEILISELEHHSNIVPWQLLCERTGATLKAIKVDANGDLSLDSFYTQLSNKTKLLAVGHVSNALGTINPIASLIADAHAVGAMVCIDGAQAAAHIDIDVQALDCDFYAFSGHKMFGPTGIGVLYGKRALLEDLPPWQGGGEMIETVRLDGSTYNRPPYKFEAGTPNIAGIIGLGAAVNFITQLPLATLVEQEHKLVQRALSGLQQLPGVRLIGEPKHRLAVVSFAVDGAHAQDIGTLLDNQAVAVRTGHHCAMPLMQALEIDGTIRASFSLYNNDEDVDRLIAGVDKALGFL